MTNLCQATLAFPWCRQSATDEFVQSLCTNNLKVFTEVTVRPPVVCVDDRLIVADGILQRTENGQYWHFAAGPWAFCNAITTKRNAKAWWQERTSPTSPGHHHLRRYSEQGRPGHQRPQAGRHFVEHDLQLPLQQVSLDGVHRRGTLSAKHRTCHALGRSRQTDQGYACNRRPVPPARRTAQPVTWTQQLEITGKEE